HFARRHRAESRSDRHGCAQDSCSPSRGSSAVGHRLRSRLRCALPGCHGKGLVVDGTNTGDRSLPRTSPHGAEAQHKGSSCFNQLIFWSPTRERSDTMKPKQTTPIPLGTAYPAPVSTSDLQEQIRRRAYQLYEERGKEDGHELDDWLQAESESRQQKVKTVAA